MNNHIEVNHSNGVNIYYTDSTTVYDNEPDELYYWRHGRRRMAWLFGVIALVVILVDGRLLPYLLAAVAIAGTVWLCVKVIKAVHASDQRRRKALAEIASRADWQHAALLRGDLDAGLYGIYPPACSKMNTPKETA